jgi:flavin-dependent dehydrogenase
VVTSSISLEQARDQSWDVVVVGTGIGGSTVGYAVAQRGLKVLFLEKGLFLSGSTTAARANAHRIDPAERLPRMVAAVSTARPATPTG